MQANYRPTENGIDAETISGPHDAYDLNGDFYAYWRCEPCGFETTDTSIRRDGCWRCGGDGR